MNDWLNVEQAAAYVGMSVSFVRRLYRTGQIVAYKPGSQVRIRREELDAWIEQQKVRPTTVSATPAARALPIGDGLRRLLPSVRDPDSKGKAA